MSRILALIPIALALLAVLMQTRPKEAKTNLIDWLQLTDWKAPVLLTIAGLIFWFFSKITKQFSSNKIASTRDNINGYKQAATTIISKKSEYSNIGTVFKNVDHVETTKDKYKNIGTVFDNSQPNKQDPRAGVVAIMMPQGSTVRLDDMMITGAGEAVSIHVNKTKE